MKVSAPSSSLVALTVGALGSAAANTAWTYPDGPVRVAAGLFATALVPVGMHLWPRVSTSEAWSRVLRLLVMTYICAAAAVVNLVHAVWLLTAHADDRRENTLLAVLLVVAVEAVMVMASLARRRPARTTGVRVTVPTTVRLPVSGNAPVPRVSDRSDDGHAWGGPHTVPPVTPEPVTTPVTSEPVTRPVTRHTVTELRPGPRDGRDDLDAITDREELRALAQAEDVAIRGSRDDIRHRIRAKRKARARDAATAEPDPEPADQTATA